MAILALLALAGAAIFLLDPIQRHLAAGPELLVTAERSRGLRVGAPVWVAGARAGRITAVRFLPPGEVTGERVLVRASIEEDAAAHVRVGARAWIQSPTLLAAPVLAVTPGPPDAPPFDYADTLRAVERLTARELLARADTARSHLDSLLAQREVVARLLEEDDGTLGRLLRDTALRRALGRDLDAARRLAGSLRDHRGLAALRAARDSGLLDTIARRGKRIAAALPERAEALGDLGRSLAALERRFERLDSLTAAGSGSLGRFRADGELGEQIRLLREDLPRTREDLFSDPFRLLRIRLF